MKDTDLFEGTKCSCVIQLLLFRYAYHYTYDILLDILQDELHGTGRPWAVRLVLNKPALYV